MSQKSNDKRVERREKSERNMNRAVVLLIAGLAAEWYLLMADRYYARGTVDQTIAWYDALGIVRWVAMAVAVAGIVLLTRCGKKPWPRRIGWAMTAGGAFFSLTSFIMRHSYPLSVTVLCVFVPVLLILGIIYLFYQAEFAIEATALSMALGALVLLNRSSSSTVRGLAALAIAGIVALFIATWLLSRKKGVLERKGRSVRIFDARTDYRRIMAVLALCLALVLLALAAPSIAFYATWGLGFVTFVLAVYYTIKLM